MFPTPPAHRASYQPVPSEPQTSHPNMLFPPQRSFPSVPQLEAQILADVDSGCQGQKGLRAPLSSQMWRQVTGANGAEVHLPDARRGQCLRSRTLGRCC